MLKGLIAAKQERIRHLEETIARAELEEQGQQTIEEEPREDIVAVARVVHERLIAEREASEDV